MPSNISEPIGLMEPLIGLAPISPGYKSGASLSMLKRHNTFFYVIYHSPTSQANLNILAKANILSAFADLAHSFIILHFLHS